MRSILDILKNAVSAVMIHRHYDYVSKHILAKHKDANLVTGLNYSETVPASLFPLSKKGIEHGWQHGRTLAQAGIKIRELVGSCQGRGPESAVRIAEGYEEITHAWLPCSCDAAANWPVYNLGKASQGVDDADPARWMNGKITGLIASDTPATFKARVTGLVERLLDEGGVNIITTHFEICVLAHSLYTAGRDLESIPEDYAPQKGGGILIVKNEDGRLEAVDYDANLNIIF